MPRGIGYVVARRDREDPDLPHDWALFIEALLRGLMGRFGSQPRPETRTQPQGLESASARRPR